MSYFDDNEDRITGLYLGSGRYPGQHRYNNAFHGTTETKDKKHMNITILSVIKTPATTAKGGAYELLDIAFKNNTFQGKVEGKKVTPFGANKPAYDVLANAASGQTFEITVVKENGFNNWTAATPAEAGASVQNSQGAANAAYVPRATASPAATNSRGFETPEERAAKQVYIVRQSSLSAAIAALSVGSKSAVPAEAAIEYASKLESFVFGKQLSVDTGVDFSGPEFDDVPN